MEPSGSTTPARLATAKARRQVMRAMMPTVFTNEFVEDKVDEVGIDIR
jgi:hypothetical protein